MKNKLTVIFQFIMFLIIIGILGITIITALELMNIIEIPKQYSILNYLPSTQTEVVVSKYDNVIVDNGKETEINNTVFTNTTFPDGVQSIEKNNYEISSSKYYYSQLDEYGKIFYDKLSQNIENIKTGTYTLEFGETFNALFEKENGNDILEKSFQSSLNAFLYDNPQIFYIDITKMYLHTEVKTYILKKVSNVYIAPEENSNYFSKGFNSKDEVNNAIEQVNNVISEIKNNLSFNNYGNYMTIRYVHDYIINNASYDTTVTGTNIYNIYGALVNKSTVCEGYAKAFKFILDQIGVESIFIFGTGINKKGENEVHSWNYVKIDDNWYAVDVTWDDPIIIGGGILTDEFRYRYFLKGANDFNKDHIADGKIINGVKFYYPELSVNNYK